MDIRIPSTSAQLVQMRITADVNPTSNLVSMAVMPLSEEPQAADFKTAAWLPGQTSSPYRCQILIGPGSPGVGALGEGVYRLWAKVTATPEIPVLPATNCLRIT